MIATSSLTLSGAYNLILREYDASGRVARESAPCWLHACTPHWTEAEYDALGRVTRLSRPRSDSNPSLQSTLIYYEGLTTRIVDPLGKQTTKISNVLGAIVRSMDHSGYYQEFDYSAFGQLRHVRDNIQNTLLLSNSYNDLGMLTAQTDRAAGSWTYKLNALGEVVEQVNGNGQTTTFEYDKLGRLTKRIEPEGTSQFNYATTQASGQKRIGRLISMSGPGYAEAYTYDALGRLATTTITSDATYTISYAYNAAGALDTLTYPASLGGSPLKLKYEYEHGWLKAVKDANAPTMVFWTADSADARGNIIAETLGNGVQTVRGYDAVTGLIDYIQSSRSGVSIQDLGYEWNAVGNLVVREDARLSLREDFGYDDLHRLTSIVGPDMRTITYDARGNIISRTGALTSGESQTIGWTSYNLPHTISGPAGYSSQFSYAPDRSRWKHVVSYGGMGEQTIYIGGLIEKVTRGSVTSWKHYIAGATGPVAVHIRRSDGTSETQYLLRDHLGSVDTVMSASGAVLARMSYAADGTRRNATTWLGEPTSAELGAIGDTTRRGFTMHEMLDNLGLTHMNGRVYDQRAGSFLSADPFIDGPGNTQGWNRYAYVKGRPLSYIDPSGYGADGMDYAADSWAYEEMQHKNWIWRRIWSRPPIQYTDLIPERCSVHDPDRDSCGKPPETDVPVFTDSKRSIDSTVDWTKVRDTVFAPWGGWEDFKYSVRCVWECQWPGNGSLEANLAGVPFIPVVGVEAATARLGSKLYDIIPYWRTAAAGFQKHHGVLDAWARANILGYRSGAAPAVVLTIEQHNATRAVFNTWRAEQGWARTPIDWTRVSPQEIQALTYRMFEAAGVPKDVVSNYFRAFDEFLYGF